MGLLRVFYSPEQVFGEEGKAGKWLIPFVAFMVVSFVVGTLIANMLDMRAVTRAWFDNHPAMASRMSAEQINKAVEDAASPAAQKRQYVIRPVMSAVILLVMTLILFGLAKMFGAELRFKQVLTVCGYAGFAYGLVSGLGGYLSLRMMSDPNTADLYNLLKLNPTMILTEGASAGAKAFYSVMASLDLLSFWYIFLLGLGLSKASGKLTVGKGVGLVCIPWGVYVIGKAGVTALMAVMVG